MRFYFGENGWPKSTLGAAPETDEEKELLVDSLQVIHWHIFTQQYQQPDSQRKALLKTLSPLQPDVAATYR